MTRFAFGIPTTDTARRKKATVRLPVDLHEALDARVRDQLDAGIAASRSGLVSLAIQRHLPAPTEHIAPAIQRGEQTKSILVSLTDAEIRAVDDTARLRKQAGLEVNSRNAIIAIAIQRLLQTDPVRPPTEVDYAQHALWSQFLVRGVTAWPADLTLALDSPEHISEYHSAWRELSLPKLDAVLKTGSHLIAIETRISDSYPEKVVF